jgi:hypothetical protein
MIYDHLVHIVRDIFPNKENIIYYGEDVAFLETLHSPEHGLGAFLLHSNPEDDWSLSKQTSKLKTVNKAMCKGWVIEFNDSFFGEDFCDLFISFSYSPWMLHENYSFVALNIKKLLKPNGLIFAVDPGDWSMCLGDHMTLREDLVKEVKRYSLLKNKEVFVYENI